MPLLLGGSGLDVSALMEELTGCWREATRGDYAVKELVRIRDVLDSDIFDDEISAIIRQIESTSRLLRDLHDLFPIYQDRIPMVLYYLQIILPCLCKTLRDLMVYLDNPGLSPKQQWVMMYSQLNEEGGLTLEERFAMYVDFLVQLVRLLSRSPFYDAQIMETKRLRILRLRHARGMPAPLGLIQPYLAPVQINMRRHWAEKIFDEPPASSTGLQHRRFSRCFGPPMADLGIPPKAIVLNKLSFDKNHLSVTLYLHADGSDVSRILCRWMDRFLNPHYSAYGVHELCVRRRGSSLLFRRWSLHKESPTVWMALFFKTWEKMVLFHCAFVALKARCPLTKIVHPEDYYLGEKRLFQGSILDDGFVHSLYVYQDERSGGIRIHTVVGDGELRKCPVWTAFVTDQSCSEDWLLRHSGHRVWITNIYLYVFCDEYRKKSQMKRHGEFEINFVHRAAADAFVDLFAPDSEDEHFQRTIENGS